jgi:hypothetical protein
MFDLRYLCLLVYRGVQHILTMRVSYKKQELVALRGRLGSPSGFGSVSVAHLFIFLCCVFYLVCLRPVALAPHVGSFAGFYILDCPFGFL